MTDNTKTKPEYEHIKTAILEVANNMNCPVFNASNITRKLFRKSTNTQEYRWILTTLHKMESEGLVGSVNWPGANNVTAWWLTSRLNQLSNHKGE